MTTKTAVEKSKYQIYSILLRFSNELKITQILNNLKYEYK